jgi:hypothetical protein
MIYFLLTLFSITIYFICISDFSDKQQYAKTAFAALISIVTYLCAKSFVIRAKYSLGPAKYKLMSIALIPLYSLSIVFYSKHTQHLDYAGHPLLLAIVILIMSDLFDFNAKYIERSGVLARQKDSFFMPPENYKGNIKSYLFKFIAFYIFVALLGDKLSIL